MHTCIPRIQVEVGGSKLEGHPELYSRKRMDKTICFAGSKSKPVFCLFVVNCEIKIDSEK